MLGPGGPPDFFAGPPDLLGPGGPPDFFGPGGPPDLLGPGGPPDLLGPGGPLDLGALGSASSSSNIAPQCGHSLSLSLTRPSQISQANISSSTTSSDPSPMSFSISPSLEQNKLIFAE